MSYSYPTTSNAYNNNRRFSIPESRFSDLSNEHKQRRNSFDYAQQAENGNTSIDAKLSESDESRRNPNANSRGCAGRSRRFICAATCCGLLVLLLLASILAYFIFIPQIIKSRLEDPALFRRLVEQSRQETDPALRPKISISTLKLGIDGEPGLSINVDADALVPAAPVSVSLNPGNWVVALNDAPIVEFRTPVVAISPSTPAKVVYNDRVKLSGLDRINKFIREFGLADEGVSGEVGRVSVTTTLDYAVLGIPMRNVDVKIQVDATGAKFATVRPLILRGNFRLQDFFDFQVTNANIDVVGSSVSVQAAIALDNKTPLDVGISTFSLTSQLDGLSPITVTASGIRIRPGKSTFTPSIKVAGQFSGQELLTLVRTLATEQRVPSIRAGAPFALAGTDTQEAPVQAPWFAQLTDGISIPISLRDASLPTNTGGLGSGLAAKVLSTLSVDVNGRGSNLAINARSQVDLPQQLPAKINLANSSVSLNVLSGPTQLFNLGISNFTLRPEIGGTMIFTPSAEQAAAARLAQALTGQQPLDLTVRDILVNGSPLASDLVLPLPVSFNLTAIQRSLLDRAAGNASSPTETDTGPADGAPLESGGLTSLATMVQNVTLAVSDKDPLMQFSAAVPLPQDLIRDFSVDVPVIVSTRLVSGGDRQASATELLTFSFNSSLRKAPSVPLNLVFTLNNADELQSQMAAFVRGSNAEDRLLVTGLTVGNMSLFGQIPLIALSRADILRVVQARQAVSNGAASGARGMDLSALLDRVQNVAIGSTQQGTLAINSTVRLPEFPLLQSIQVPTVAFSAQINGAEVVQTRLQRANLSPNSDFSPNVLIQFNESDETQQRMAQLSLESPIVAGVSGFQLGGIRSFSRVSVDMDLGSIQQRLGNRTSANGGGDQQQRQPPLPIRDVSLQVSTERPEARLQTSLVLGQIPFPFSVSVPFSVGTTIGDQQLARVQMGPSAITRDSPALQVDTVFAESDAAKDAIADFALNERSNNRVAVTGFQIAGAKTFSRIRPVSLSRADLVAMANRQGAGAGTGAGDGGVVSLLNMIKSAQVNAPTSRSEILINSVIAMPNLALPVPVTVEVPPVSLVGSLGNVPVLKVRTALPKLTTADRADIQPSVALVFDSSEEVQNRVAQINLANTSATVSGVRIGGIRLLERVALSMPLALPARGEGGGNNSSPALGDLPLRDTVVAIAQDRPVVDLSTAFAVPDRFSVLQTDFETNIPISVGFNLGSSQLAQFSTPGQLRRQATIPLSAAVTFSNEPGTKTTVARFASSLMASIANGTQAPADPIAVRGLRIGGVQTFSRMSLVSVTSTDLLARLGRGGGDEQPDGGAGALLSMVKSVQVSSPSDQSAINVGALFNMPQLPIAATVNIPPITLNGQLNNIPVMSIRTTLPSLNTQAGGDLRPNVTLAFDSSEDVQNRVGQVSFANAVAAATGLRVGGIQTFDQVALSMALPNLSPNALLERARSSTGSGNGSGGLTSLLGETSVVISEQTPTINIRSEANVPDAVPFDFAIDLPVRAAVDVGTARVTQIDIPTRFSRQDRKVPLTVGVQMSNEDPAKAALAQFASLAMSGASGNDQQNRGPQIAVRGIQIGGVSTFSRLSVVSVSSADVRNLAQSLVAARDAPTNNNTRTDAFVLSLIRSVQVTAPVQQSTLNINANLNQPQLPLPVTLQIPPVVLAARLSDIPIMNARATLPQLTSAGGQVNSVVDLTFDSSQDIQQRVGTVNFANASGTVTGVRLGGIRTFENVAVTMQLPAIDLAGRLGGGGAGANRTDSNQPQPPRDGGSGTQLPIRNVRVNFANDAPNVDIQSTIDLPSAAIPFDFDINVPVSLGLDMGSSRLAQVLVPSRLTRQAAEAGSVGVAVGVQLSNEAQIQDSVAAFANQLFATDGSSSNNNNNQGGGRAGDQAAPPMIVRGIQLGGIQTFSRLPVLQVSANEVRQVIASRLGGNGNNGNNGDGGRLDFNRISQLVSGVTLSPSDNEPALTFASIANVPGALPFVQSINLPQIQASLDVNGIPVTQLSVDGAGDVRGDQPSQVPINAKLLFDTSDQVQRQISELPISQQAVFNVGAGGVRVGGIRTFERVRIQQQVNVADLIARSGGGGDGGRQQPPQANNPGNNGPPGIGLQSLVKVNSVTTANNAPTLIIDSQVAIPEQLTQPLANLVRSVSVGPIQVGLAAQDADFMSLQVGHVVIDPSNRSPVPAPVAVQFDNSQQARQGVSNFVNSIRRQQTIGQVPLAVRGVQFGSPNAPITTFSQISLALPVQAALAQVSQGANQGFQDPVSATLANVIRNLGGGRVEIQQAKIAQAAISPQLTVDPTLNLRQPITAVEQLVIPFFSSQLLIGGMSALQLDLPAGFQVQGRSLSGTNGNSLPTQLQFNNAGPAQQAVAEVGGPVVSAFLSGNGVQALQGNVGFSGLVFGGGKGQVQTFQDVVLDLPAGLFVASLQQAFPRNATAPAPPRDGTPPPPTPPPAEEGRRRRGLIGRIGERLIGGGRAGGGAGGAGGGLGGLVNNLGSLSNMIKPGSLDVSLDGLTAVRASATLLMPLGFPVGIQLGTLAVDAMLQERPVIDVQVPGINNANAANELPLNDIRVGLDRGERDRFFGAIGSGLRLARGLVSGELVQNLGVGGLVIGDGAGQIQTFRQVQLAVGGLLGGAGGGGAAAAQAVSEGEQAGRQTTSVEPSPLSRR